MCKNSDSSRSHSFRMLSQVIGEIGSCSKVVRRALKFIFNSSLGKWFSCGVASARSIAELLDFCFGMGAVNNAFEFFAPVVCQVFQQQAFAGFGDRLAQALA